MIISRMILDGIAMSLLAGIITVGIVNLMHLIFG